MKTPTPNAELLDAVIEQISKDKKHWDQGSWRDEPISADQPDLVTERGKKVLPITCGTSFCFAGWAVQIGSETKPKWANTYALWANSHDNLADIENGTITASDRARRLLGLTIEQAGALFSGSNSLREIKTYVRRIKSGRPIY